MNEPSPVHLHVLLKRVQLLPRLEQRPCPEVKRLFHNVSWHLPRRRTHNFPSATSTRTSVNKESRSTVIKMAFMASTRSSYAASNVLK